jgi:four helix bundle protein
MPNAPRTHRSLIAWQLGMDLAAESYRLANILPAVERFGLASQIRRAGASIPANIAEGYGRTTKGEFRRFIDISNGSLKELETHFELAVRVQLLDVAAIASAMGLADRTGAVLRKLRESLR